MSNKIINGLIANYIGIALSIISFIFLTYNNIFQFTNEYALGSMPALFISIIIITITQKISVNSKIDETIEKTIEKTDRIYDAVKDHLHVTTVGSPEKALKYINEKIESRDADGIKGISKIQNTSFNIKNDDSRINAQNTFYNTSTYSNTKDLINSSCTKGLVYHDICDEYGKERCKKQFQQLKAEFRGKENGYDYKIIKGKEPQMNFIILRYQDGKKEVLFNWDIRVENGEEAPIVLLSRDPHIFTMFATQYRLLRESAVYDHDRDATK